MPKRPKRRTVSSYRAASLKAWRTRRRMREARIAAIEAVLVPPRLRTIFDEILPPERTINRIPKVEWK